MNTTTRVCWICGALLALSWTPSQAQSPTAQQPVPEKTSPAPLTRESFKGDWRAVKGVLAGEDVAPATLQKISLTINDQGYRVKQGDTTDIGEIKYDLKSEPAHLDLVGKEGPTKGLTLLAIAKIEGDVMTVAYNLGVLDGNADRPRDFVSDRTEHRNLVLTYQRVK